MSRKESKKKKKMDDSTSERSSTKDHNTTKNSRQKKSAKSSCGSSNNKKHSKVELVQLLLSTSGVKGVECYVSVNSEKSVSSEAGFDELRRHLFKLGSP